MLGRLRSNVFQRVARALQWYVRAQPRPKDQTGAEKRVFILLMSAWGMGGTIRTILNMAGHLASRGYEVEILSIGRGRDEPFFGDFPEGVKVTVLDDKRADHRPSLLHPIRRALRKRSSVLINPEDRAARGFNLWVDWQVAKRLRRKCGFLVGTRPGLNLLAVRLAPPGMVLVGQEHMHLEQHPEPVQDAIERRYRKLAALAVLTERDRRRYRKLLPNRVPVVRIPNTVRDLGGVRPDLDAKRVLAAGRLGRQKGYDRLIKTWEIVARTHPDWELRICGEGRWRAKLEAMIEKRDLGNVITLAEPAKDMGAEMAGASIYVLSSRWEGLPLVLLEAMSVGMGVVSFDCPTGPREVIVDRENGLLVRPRKIAVLAAALVEMMDDEDLRRRCAEGAIETARGYSMEAVGPQWEAFLRDAWDRHAAA